MTDKKSIFQRLTEIGARMDSHYSDLYVRASDDVRSILATYEYRGNVTTFRGTDGALWFDIPFAFDPYWGSAEDFLGAWLKSGG